MPELSADLPPSATAWPPPAVAPDDGPEASVRDGLTSLALVLAWFGVAAVVAALVWWQVTPLAAYIRTADNASMDEEQLAKQFSADGWFIVIGSVAGLASGLVLLLLRRRNPILMVLLVAAGGAFATYVMLQVGLVLGPSDPGTVLRTNPPPVGGKVPLQLKPAAHAVWFVWSVASLAGGILGLWITEARETARRQHAALSSHGQPPPGA